MNRDFDISSSMVLSQGSFHFLLLFFQDGTNTIFIDGANSRCRYLKGNPSIFFWDVKALLLKIWIKSSFCLDIRVRNIVSYLWLLTC